MTFGDDSDADYWGLLLKSGDSVLGGVYYDLSPGQGISIIDYAMPRGYVAWVGRYVPATRWGPETFCEQDLIAHHSSQGTIEALLGHLVADTVSDIAESEDDWFEQVKTVTPQGMGGRNRG